MFRFFAFIATLLTFVGGLDDKASSIWDALCIISSGLMFVGLKPFLDRPVERVISKDKNYLITISLALFIFGGISYDIYEMPEYDIPEALNPSEAQRIGDTAYFKRIVTLEDIEKAKGYVSGGAPATGKSTLNYPQFIIFFLTTAVLYILLITFNAHWNQSKKFSLGVLTATLALVNYYSTEFNIASAEPFENFTAQSTLNLLYPTDMSHCAATYIDTKIRPEMGSLVAQSSAPDKTEWRSIRSDHIRTGMCDSESRSQQKYGSACDELLACVSAVHSIGQKSNKKFLLLSYEEAKIILNTSSTAKDD
tara:strand:- start:65 stop:988 length:924 start_codon:yes stop_codon:yes gene_type:complete